MNEACVDSLNLFLLLNRIIFTAHEIHFPAEFSSDSNQTHLSMLIDVFRIIRQAQVGEFDQRWS